MKTIKATFIIQEDSHNAGVMFYGDKGKKISWKNLSYREQVRMLNAWINMYQLFYRFLKEEDDDNERIQDQ